ncbi:hypothetical protein F5884DRAFT_866769 [Xylogone sp. PMI_703]|nr:hypothetical protein F5884DRAFT_866769 [Xylogone sp. PMI_703]
MEPSAVESSDWTLTEDPNTSVGVFLSLDTIKKNWDPKTESLQDFIERAAGRYEVHGDPTSDGPPSYNVIRPEFDDDLDTDKTELPDFVKQSIAEEWLTEDRGRMKVKTERMDSKLATTDSATGKTKAEFPHPFSQSKKVDATAAINDFLLKNPGLPLDTTFFVSSATYYVTNDPELVENVKKFDGTVTIGEVKDDVVEIIVQKVKVETDPKRIEETKNRPECSLDRTAFASAGAIAATKPHTCCDRNTINSGKANGKEISPDGPTRTSECCYCGVPLQTVANPALDLKVLEKAIERIEKQQAGELVTATKDLKQALPRSARRKNKNNKTLTINESFGLDSDKKEFPEQLVKVFADALQKREIFVTREYALAYLHKCDGKIVPAIGEIENNILTRKDLDTNDISYKRRCTLLNRTTGELTIDRTGRFSRAVEFSLLECWRTDPSGSFAKDEVLNYLEDEDREMIVFHENPTQSYFYFLITRYFPERRHHYWINIFSIEAQYRSDRQQIYNSLMKNVEKGELTREKLGQMMDQYDGLAPPTGSIKPHRATTEKRRNARKKFFSKTLQDMPAGETDPKMPLSRAMIQKTIRKLLTTELQ